MENSNASKLPMRARPASRKGVTLTPCPLTKQRNLSGVCMSGKYCVYLHLRKSDGRVFYVGKGYGNRPYAILRRSEYWKRVYKKHGRTVHVAVKNLNEICAFSLEVAAIRFYGRDNLTNATDGGEGRSGHVPSKAQREKCSASNKGKAPSKIAVERAKKKNSKPVGTTCGLVFSSAAEAARSLFPDNQRSAKTCISASCNGRKVSGAFGYEFRFIVDGELQETAFNPNPWGKGVVRSDGVFFNSAQKAVDDLKRNGWPKAQNGNIIQCCKGKVKSAYGYTWEYAE